MGGRVHVHITRKWPTTAMHTRGQQWQCMQVANNGNTHGWPTMAIQMGDNSQAGCSQWRGGNRGTSTRHPVERL